VARPFWSGQIRISLVAFGVKLFPATEAKSEIHFHEISRKSGERVHHQKVAANDEEPVEKDDVVKGYEYSKGEYVQIDPDEIAHLRIATRKTLELEQFVDLNEIDAAFFEKPYFVIPESDSQAEAFGVVRKALAETGKAGLGKIAVSGREHLMAISAPRDEKLRGLMAYTLRYVEELRNAEQYFADIKPGAVSAESLSLAKELIQRKAARFDPRKFTDEYEAALRELVDAKLKHLPLPVEEKAAPRGKVINLMDALRRSVNPAAEKKTSTQAKDARSTGPADKHRLRVVEKKGKGAEKRRKSA
jgi:DNA end-binding protein Ku